MEQAKCLAVYKEKPLQMFSILNHIKLQKDSGEQEFRMEWNRTIEEVGGRCVFYSEVKEKIIKNKGGL